MMADIFSSFDPATCSSYSLSPELFWILSFLCLVPLQASLWISPSRISWISMNFMEIMSSQASRTFMLHLKGFPVLLVSLFIMLISLNLLGLIPYVFSSTSHLLLTLSLGLPLWLSLIISGMVYAPKKFVAHFLPSGAPDWLNPFLVLTETISISVRFITLSFRLAANMSAGHILLGLMGIAGSSALFNSISSFAVLTTLQLGYIIFEMAIGLIQAYIFCLLLTLYSDDHPEN